MRKEGRPMKKLSLFVFFAWYAATIVWGQAVPYPQDDASDAAQAPASSIDLLRRSLGSSDVASAAGVSAAPAASSAAPSSNAQPARTDAQTGRSAASERQSSAAAAVSASVPADASVSLPRTSAKSSVSAAEAPAPAASVSAPRTSAVSASSAASVRRPRRTRPAASSASASLPKNVSTATVSSPLQTAAENELTVPPAAGTAADMEQASQDAIAQEELDYAARMLQQTRDMMSSGRFIPPSASETAQSVPSVERGPFHPEDFRPNVQWQRSNTTHFTIYTQKRDNGIGSSNMGMIFESAYSTLRRNIPWMMSDKVRVFVYQDHNSYLKHEPNAKAWTRALAYPTRGEIVVYDEPGKQQELKEVFTHELVHIFTQKYFDSHHTGRLMTPEWLDEGLAVYMEDQAYSGRRGGPWANDFRTLNFQRSKETQLANFSSSNMFGGARSFTSGRQGGGPVLYFMPFDDFMQNGSLASMEGRDKTQDWYFQAYTMVRFLLNPSGGMSPSNRMQFEQFTRLIAQGEQVRDSRTGFPARDADGRPIYRPYPVEQALSRAYRYNSIASFEDAFWRWADNAR